MDLIEAILKKKPDQGLGFSTGLSGPAQTF
jgi:hypothetical protein